MKKLFLIWYEPKILNEIGILTHDGSNYQFEYTNYNDNDLQLFSKNGLFPGFLELNEKYESPCLFLSIKSRLPSRSRIDYEELLKKQGVNNLSDEYEILKKTKGQISTDNFIFVTEEELERLKKENQEQNINF